MGRGERAFRAVGEVQPPQALVLFTHRGERVLDAGAQDFAETAGLAAPLALIGAVWESTGMSRSASACGKAAGGVSGVSRYPGWNTD